MVDEWTNLLKGYNRYVRPNFNGKFLSKNFCHLKLKPIVIIKKKEFLREKVYEIFQ